MKKKTQIYTAYGYDMEGNITHIIPNIVFAKKRSTYDTKAKPLDYDKYKITSVNKKV